MALVVPNGQSRQKSVGLIGPFDISRWLVEEVMSDDRGAEIDVAFEESEESLCRVSTPRNPPGGRGGGPKREYMPSP